MSSSYQNRGIVDVTGLFSWMLSFNIGWFSKFSVTALVNVCNRLGCLLISVTVLWKRLRKVSSGFQVFCIIAIWKHFNRILLKGFEHVMTNGLNAVCSAGVFFPSCQTFASGLLRASIKSTAVSSADISRRFYLFSKFTITTFGERL